jgi:hypothetical protein
MSCSLGTRFYPASWTGYPVIKCENIITKIKRKKEKYYKYFHR